MNELTEIYKRIEYLRNNGVKMKEIADRVDMAPSVLSALYSSVLPAYIDLLKTRTPDEALDEALALVNNVSKKRLLNNVSSMKLLLLEMEPEQQSEAESGNPLVKLLGMGINAMVVAISAAAGPSVASGILSIASWHWLFAINVPLGITALLLGIKHLPRQEERSKRKFDFVSAIANAVTFGLLIYTLDGFAHHEEMDFLVLQLIILAIVGTFYVRRQLTQTTPLLPLDLLRIPIFRLSILTSICSFIAQMAAMVSLPFFLQNTLGHSEVMTGLLLTPWPLATLVTAPLAGYLVERIHPGILGSIGMALFAVGLFSLSGLTAESSDISIILRLMLCGAGFGLFQTPNNSTIISSAPTKRSGGASGMLGMARLLGQTFGTTLVALLFSFVVHNRSTAVCLMVGSGFAVVAAIVSSLRLSQPSTLKRETNRS